MLLLLSACVSAPPAPGSPALPEACPSPTVTTTVYGHFVADSEQLRAPTGLAVADLDGDGTHEVWVATMAGSYVLRLEAGGLGPHPGFGDLPPGLAVAAADPDRDGDADLFLGGWAGTPDVMLWNDGTGTFSAEELPDSLGQTTTGAFADFDGDGDLDLLVARGENPDSSSIEQVLAERSPGDAKSLYLWEDGAYVDASEWIPEEVQPGYTFQAAPFDADDDGDLDLWMANDFGPYILPDQLLLNQGDRFTVGDYGSTVAHYGMGVGVGDADGNGLADLFVTDVGGPDLLLSMGDGTVVDATRARGADLGDDPDRLTSWGTRFLDVNGDGLDDLPVAFGRLGDGSGNDVSLLNDGWTADDIQRDALLLADGGAGFVDAGDALGFSDIGRGRAMVTGDLDEDRIPEVIVAGKLEVVLYRLGGGCENRLVVRVEGDDETVAVGAEVTVVTSERTTTRWVLPSATGSASADEVSAGLGRAEEAEVHVTWPDGRTATYGAEAGDFILATPEG